MSDLETAKELEELTLAGAQEFADDMAEARRAAEQALANHSEALKSYYLTHNLEFKYGSGYFQLLQEVDMRKKKRVPEGKNTDERKANEAQHWAPVDNRLLVLKNRWIEARHWMEQAEAIMDWAKKRVDSHTDK